MTRREKVLLLASASLLALVAACVGSDAIPASIEPDAGGGSVRDGAASNGPDSGNVDPGLDAGPLATPSEVAKSNLVAWLDGDDPTRTDVAADTLLSAWPNRGFGEVFSSCSGTAPSLRRALFALQNQSAFDFSVPSTEVQLGRCLVGTPFKQAILAADDFAVFGVAQYGPKTASDPVLVAIKNSQFGYPLTIYATPTLRVIHGSVELTSTLAPDNAPHLFAVRRRSKVVELSIDGKKVAEQDGSSSSLTDIEAGAQLFVGSSQATGPVLSGKVASVVVVRVPTDSDMTGITAYLTSRYLGR